MAMVNYAENHIRESIEDKLKKVGYVKSRTHQYEMIYELLGPTEGQPASLIMGLKDWIIELYSEIFNAAQKGNIGKYLIIPENKPVANGSEAFEILVNHEKIPFNEIAKELQTEGYRIIENPTTIK
jgi:hypothetical protein